MIINVSTIDDPRLDAYARLTEVQLRNKLEPEKGMFIAESSKVIERARRRRHATAVAADGGEIPSRHATHHRANRATLP